MTGEFLIRSTAMLAIAGYSLRLLTDAAGSATPGRQRTSRWFWTLGCAALLIHTACAFQFLHHWSHAAAWEYTRRRTLELTGWDSGIGLWVNYVMTAIWLIDVVGWWGSLDWPRQRIWYWTVQTLFAFLVFNATAVFGPAYWTPIVGAMVVILVGLATFTQGTVETES